MQELFKTFASPADFEAFLARGERAFLFKHSTQCSTSAEAEGEFAALAADGAIPIYQVLVIESRPVSDAIARRLGIPHQSPQAILVENGAAAWSRSHWEITARALREAWGETG